MAEQGQDLEAEVARLGKMVRKLISLLGVRERAWRRDLDAMLARRLDDLKLAEARAHRLEREVERLRTKYEPACFGELIRLRTQLALWGEPHILDWVRERGYTVCKDNRIPLEELHQCH